MRMRRFRFSLKTLLLVLTVVAVYLGLEANRVAKQREAMAIIEPTGVRALYDYQYELLQTDPKKFSRTFQTMEPPCPKWLHDLVGPDYFRTVVQVGGILTFDDDFHFGDEELQQVVARLPHLRRLWLHDLQLTDAGLRDLSSLKNLEALSLDESEIGDEGMQIVGQCTRLKNLQLCGTNVTDAGLLLLQQLRKLERIGLSGVDASDTGVAVILNASSATLYKLNLQYTNTTNELVDDLLKLQRLDFLNVKNTKITAEGASRIRAAFPDCRLLHESLKSGDRDPFASANGPQKK